MAEVQYSVEETDDSEDEESIDVNGGIVAS